jgi:hypothetical protein
LGLVVAWLLIEVAGDVVTWCGVVAREMQDV